MAEVDLKMTVKMNVVLMTVMGSDICLDDCHESDVCLDAVMRLIFLLMTVMKVMFVLTNVTMKIMPVFIKLLTVISLNMMIVLAMFC